MLISYPIWRRFAIKKSSYHHLSAFVICQQLTFLLTVVTIFDSQRRGQGMVKPRKFTVGTTRIATYICLVFLTKTSGNTAVNVTRGRTGHVETTPHWVRPFEWRHLIASRINAIAAITNHTVVATVTPSGATHGAMLSTRK